MKSYQPPSRLYFGVKSFFGYRSTKYIPRNDLHRRSRYAAPLNEVYKSLHSNEIEVFKNMQKNPFRSRHIKNELRYGSTHDSF